MTLVLQIENVTRVFRNQEHTLTILNDVSLSIMSGNSVAIRGPSGCGKTTLLHIAGTLDRPTSGSVTILGENPWTLSSRRLAAFRNHHIGFIFQEHQLLPQCSVLENVLLPTLSGFPVDDGCRMRALQLLERVGLKHRLHHRPAHLSGGERQRVAVCRALINRPSLLLADEPTGNLDPETAGTIGRLLLEIAAENQAAILCVTHNDELASLFESSVNIREGRIVSPAAVLAVK
jgi:lipoprotein-releasing system ATP-binding protein